MLLSEHGLLITGCSWRYQASGLDKIRELAGVADLPVDEIIAVADTVAVLRDPQPASALARATEQNRGVPRRLS